MTDNIFELINKSTAVTTTEIPWCTKWQIFKLLQFYYKSEQSYLGGACFFSKHQTVTAKMELYLQISVNIFYLNFTVSDISVQLKPEEN